MGNTPKKDKPVYSLSDNYKGDNGQKLQKHRVIVKEMVQQYNFTYQQLHDTVFAYEQEILATANQIAELIKKKANLEQELKNFKEEVATVESHFPDLSDKDIVKETEDNTDQTTPNELGDASGDTEITNNQE